MKNQGISLITLIITIIVIIILAAIVIFTGLRTPDSAQFSAFTNDVDTVYTAMIDKFADLKVEHAVKGDYRTNEQIYIELATGYGSSDKAQYAIMNTDGIKVGSTSMATDGTKCQYIVPKSTERTGVNRTETITVTGDDSFTATSAENKLGISLPKVREHVDGWYVTDDGRIFNSTGFSYNGNTYFNASYYAKGSLVTTHKEDRASAISKKMHDNTGVFEVSKKVDGTTAID